ncbi:YceD family protein [Phenylobacterium soli]|uniref:DUF177 domain-containing protein n=1 Tax=Phenylobacterium soli TaxID=2170551 RepID=A0A328AK31_9CAUL|nr:DUF177 domain-containing protein [Phenylobacterium soli]RAK55252.1 DUF177 domain-containing protein [Phenylobacterium soli]
MSEAWTTPVRLYELARGPVRARLEPDEAERAAVAKTLGLKRLPKLVADVTVRPWLDGAEITGRFDAVVEYVCSVSLEPFEAPVSGEIAVQVVPAGSALAQPEDAAGEAELDPDAPDPPDVLEGEAIDLAAYVVEHLALELDPFPRKPGAEFEFTPPAPEESPFAVLKKLKDDKS